MGRFAKLLDLAAWLVLAILLAASLARPLFYWDSWAYHLPFSAMLWDIGGARSHFVLSDEMRHRWDGFPLAAELIQGLLWKLTGTINATALVNSAAFAVFAVTASRALNASFAVLVFAALAFPLVALHASSTYIDLFVGACIAYQAVAAIRIEALVRRAASGKLAAWCVAYVASAALAGNSKITAVVLSAAIGAFLLAYLLVTRAERRRITGVGAVVLVAGIAAAGSMLSNVRAFGNPVYPFATRVAGVHLHGPEPEYRSYPEYTARLGPLARPVNWLASISEIDWRIRGIDPGYRLDSWTGDGPLDAIPPRTGGYWPPLAIGSLALAAWLVLRVRRSTAGIWREHRFLIALFLFLTLAGAFMPQSHELRYSLHWPLLLALVVAVLVRTSVRSRAGAGIALAYLAALAVSQHRLDYSLRVAPIVTQAETIGLQTRSPPVAEVRARRAVCLGPEYQPRQFAYSAVFHGGDYVVEQGWTGCVRYPAYDPPPP